MPVGCGWPEPVFGPAVLYFLACGGDCHTGLLLWLCRRPKLSAVWLAAAGVL
jgi:hypothetical protein